MRLSGAPMHVTTLTAVVQSYLNMIVYKVHMQKQET